MANFRLLWHYKSEQLLFLLCIPFGDLRVVCVKKQVLGVVGEFDYLLRLASRAACHFVHVVGLEVPKFHRLISHNGQEVLIQRHDGTSYLVATDFHGGGTLLCAIVHHLPMNNCAILIKGYENHVVIRDLESIK